MERFKGAINGLPMPARMAGIAVSALILVPLVFFRRRRSQSKVGASNAPCVLHCLVSMAYAARLFAGP
jgi:hypothetical protein